MKTCSKCGVTKPLLEFNKRARSSDGYQQHCKVCHKVANRRHYNANKEAYVSRARKWTDDWRKQILPIVSAAKKNGCTQCGEQREWVLDFHHISRDDKSMEVSKLVRWGSLDKLQQELQKCVVLCRNCHADLHYREYRGEGKR